MENRDKDVCDRGGFMTAALLSMWDQSTIDTWSTVTAVLCATWRSIWRGTFGIFWYEISKVPAYFCEVRRGRGNLWCFSHLPTNYSHPSDYQLTHNTTREKSAVHKDRGEAGGDSKVTAERYWRLRDTLPWGWVETTEKGTNLKRYGRWSQHYSRSTLASA